MFLNFKLNNTIKNNNENFGNIISPFWARSNESKSDIAKNNSKKTFKFVLKWLKLLLYAFLLLMGLWGCFQTMVDPPTRTDVVIGQGMEFGFPWGTTGDWRYDLFSNGSSSQYYTYTDWSLNYGPFYAFFVWPGAKFVLELMYPISNWWGGLNALLAIFVLLLVIRAVTLLISIRSTIQSERMSEIQGKLSEINAKYKDIKDPSARQKKHLETTELYKKYNIKPFAMFEQVFVTLPIFLIVYRVVTILRPIKVTILFDIWDLGKTPLNEIFSNLSNGGWVYIFFLLIIVPTQIISQKIPQWLAKSRNKKSFSSPASPQDKQTKRMKITQTVMTVILVFVVVSSPSGIGLYWFLSSLFSIGQSYLIHYMIKKKRSRGTSLEEKLKSLGV